MYRARRLDAIALFWALTVTIVAFPGFLEANTTDMEANPQTGFLESVGLNQQGYVVHTTDPGPLGKTTSVTISTGVGLNPRLSISGSGNTSVVWTNSAGLVLYRKHDLMTRTWTGVESDADGAVVGTAPGLVAGDLNSWVAYEEEDNGDRVVSSVEIIDSAEPWAKSPVATVSGSQDLDLHVFQGEGAVWIVWDDSATQLAWSEKEVSGLWSIPGTMTYDPANKAAGYLAIQDLVLDP